MFCIHKANKIGLSSMKALPRDKHSGPLVKDMWRRDQQQVLNKKIQKHMEKYRNNNNKTPDLVTAGTDKPFSFKSNLKAEHEKLVKALIGRKLRELISATTKEKKNKSL